VTLVSATTGTGVAELVRGFDAHRAWLDAGGQLADRRRRHQARWILKRLREEFGVHGIERLGGGDGLIKELLRERVPPLTRHEELRKRILSLYGSPEGERT
jgi:putative protein kinase ArgK-like GTPase of G3E family